MSELIPSNDFAEITRPIESAKQRVYRTVNTALFERIVSDPGKVSPLVTQTLLRLSRMCLSGIQRVCCVNKSQFSDRQCDWIPAPRLRGSRLFAGMTAKRMPA